MHWTDLCEKPELSNLPYKIQTDKWDNIVMSPASNEHGMYQAKIITLLSQIIPAGFVISECSVQTSEGIKVADVAWFSSEFIQKNKNTTPFQEAPELCIEIISPSNTKAEMCEKKELYFAKGCQEFWLCDSNGNITFYTNTEKRPRSHLFERFPCRVELYQFC